MVLGFIIVSWTILLSHEVALKVYYELQCAQLVVIVFVMLEIANPSFKDL